MGPEGHNPFHSAAQGAPPAQGAQQSQRQGSGNGSGSGGGSNAPLSSEDATSQAETCGHAPQHHHGPHQGQHLHHMPPPSAQQVHQLQRGSSGSDAGERHAQETAARRNHHSRPPTHAQQLRAQAQQDESWQHAEDAKAQAELAALGRGSDGGAENQLPPLFIQQQQQQTQAAGPPTTNPTTTTTAKEEAERARQSHLSEMQAFFKQVSGVCA